MLRDSTLFITHQRATKRLPLNCGLYHSCYSELSSANAFPKLSYSQWRRGDLCLNLQTACHGLGSKDNCPAHRDSLLSQDRVSRLGNWQN